jgi:nicotinamide mononucleotide (NMN) deamidase PncC
MPISVEQLITDIHHSPTRLVLAVAGGGSGAVARLLEMPGASRTVLEAVVPYSANAMIDWLGGVPDQFCAEATARAMAMAAYLRACALDEGNAALAGVGVTASLASDRPKRGLHRVHLAIQTDSRTRSTSLGLNRGHESRAEEERIVSRMVINAVAEACGIDGRLDLELRADERPDESNILAPQAWRDLLAGTVEMVRHGGEPEPESTAGQASSGTLFQSAARAIFPGAFNPIHRGHRRMIEIARQELGDPVELELSILNVDKPPLDFIEIERRLAGIGPGTTVWLTRSPTFEQKSRQFPDATFIVGADTLRRIADPRYYGDDADGCRRAIDGIAARGCWFLVFGRLGESAFEALPGLELSRTLTSICREVPASVFREDVSSTEIRRAVSSKLTLGPRIRNP